MKTWMKPMSLVGTALAFATCLTLPACTNSQAGGQCQIDGKVNGLEGEWIHLSYLEQDTVEVKDSALITNGAFVFDLNLKMPAAPAALYVGDPTDYRTAKYTMLFLEPGQMTVTLDTANFMRPTVTGSVAQAENDSLNAALEQIQNRLTAVQDSMRSGSYPERQAAFEAQLEEGGKQMTQARIEFVKSHPASFAAAYQLMFIMGEMDYETLKGVYDAMSDEVKQFGNLKDVRKELAVLEKVQPGQPAPLFRAMSYKGDSIGIADLKGKVVLLDFWASWCVPCRKSFPHVKALYEKYHDQGFEVLCVSDDDSNPEKWEEAIEKDGLQAFHHVLRGLKWDRSKGPQGFDHSNDISDLYAIHYLPTKYLVDREGKIVGKLTDEELDAKLKELFGK